MITNERPKADLVEDVQEGTKVPPCSLLESKPSEGSHAIKEGFDNQDDVKGVGVNAEVEASSEIDGEHTYLALVDIAPVDRYCPACKVIHGNTTQVRKSTGLYQGEFKHLCSRNFKKKGKIKRETKAKQNHAGLSSFYFEC